MDRRRWMIGAGSLLLAPGSALGEDPALAALEARSGGRLGVAAVDVVTGRALGNREDQRFAMCSTFKLVLAAAILDRADRGALDLRESVPIRAEDLVTYAPVTEPRVGRSLSLGALCEAVLLLSDNAAANLLLGRIGGPEGWTAYVRGLGDEVSRLDRTETELNSNLPDDPRDTTTPAAMLGTMRTLLLGDALSEGARRQLTRWMIRCRTGTDRLRAGFPRGSTVGDKTGTSNNGECNDLAVVWPRGGAGPWLVAAFYDRADGDAAGRNAVLAEVARTVTTALGDR